MPSDPRMATALRALAGQIERYRSAVVATAEELRGYLANHTSSENGGDENVAAGLGQFAVGLIDVDRFASLVGEAAAENSGALEIVEKAYTILSEIASGGDDAFRVELRPGGRLREALADRWAEMGRAFAAARLAGMATRGGLSSSQPAGPLEPMRFERWNEAERGLAPPLAVELDGADLHAGDLAEFLDGGVKVVLVVRGDAPPAPLVRLITPSTFVLQTADEAGLDRFAEAEGPAVAALMPEGAAGFLHDPARGARPSDRLEVFSIPEESPQRPVGGLSVRQQREELEQLRALAEAAAEGAVASEPEPAATAPEDPVGKLAAWLLSQADLDDLEQEG